MEVSTTTVRKEIERKVRKGVDKDTLLTLAFLSFRLLFSVLSTL